MKAFRNLHGARVLVNLTNGEALEGTVGQVGSSWVDLKNTKMHDQNGRGSLDGTVVVLEASILWVQVVS